MGHAWPMEIMNKGVFFRESSLDLFGSGFYSGKNNNNK